VEKVFLRKRSRLFELIGSFAVVHLPTTPDIYEPIVDHLGDSKRKREINVMAFAWRERMAPPIVPMQNPSF
jgi:hypothetical protein